jgi:hypothetical protein
MGIKDGKTEWPPVPPKLDTEELAEEIHDGRLPRFDIHGRVKYRERHLDRHGRKGVNGNETRRADWV